MPDNQRKGVYDCGAGSRILTTRGAPELAVRS
jgi:hypothetical protein